MSVTQHAYTTGPSTTFATDHPILPKKDISETHRIATRIYNSAPLAWSDLALLSFALAFATLEGYRGGFSENLATYLDLRVSVRNLCLLALCLAHWRLSLWTVGLYRSNSTRDLIRRVVNGVLLCTPASVFALLQRHTGEAVVVPTLFFVFSTCVLLLFSRGVVSISAVLFHVHARRPRVAVIIGSGNIAQQLAVDLQQSVTSSYAIHGFFDSEARPGSDVIGTHLGGFDRLSELLMHTPVDDVFVGLPLRSHYDDIERIVEIVESAGVQMQFPDNFVAMNVAKRVDHDEDRVIMKMVHHDSRLYIKRLFDIQLAALGLLLLLPVFAVIALIIRLTSRGPVFFKQQRYGLNKRRFDMIKFRSMVVDAEQRQAHLEHLNETSGPIFKIKKDPRITRIGSFLRKTSLDELPQLWNVLCGEMSLVGPRPLPLRDVARFSELRLMRRFSVLPGMTGLWQVSGRSNTAFDGLVDLDLRYIDQWSLMMDVRILAKTIPAVVRGSGAA